MERKKSVIFSAARLILLALAAAVFLLACSLSTTPLLKYSVGQDSAFFRLVGQGMTQGKLPYRDYFDMKGPYLFWLEYLGAVIAPGRLGIFLVQWLCLLISLYFAVRCFDLATEDGAPLWASLLLLLPIGYVMSYTMTGGNLTEELSLPFLMPCLYLFLKYLNGTRLPSPENQDHSLKAGFFYGVVFGVMALIRVTNAALIGAILLTVTCNLIVWKRFKNLFANAGMFLLGVAAGLLPGLFWCWWKGILWDMLSQVFLFGFAYSEEGGLLESLRSMGTVRVCLLLPLIPLAFLAVYREKDWKCWLFFIASALTVYAAALMGNGYCHYFTLAIPNLVFAGFLLLRGFRRSQRWRRSWRVACLCLSCLIALDLLRAQWPVFRPRALEEVRYAMYCAMTDTEEREDYDAIQKVLSQIPEEERNAVYVYGLTSCSGWYLQAGLQPPTRYADWQPHYIQLDPEIGREIEGYLRSSDARWVVTGAEGAEPEAIQSILEEDYQDVFQAGAYRLWVKKET